MERTFAIIKPDATAKRYTGRILQRIEEAGFTIRAMKTLRLTQREAEGFYAVHRERPVLQGAHRVHGVGPDRGHGSRGARCHQEVAHADGRDRPREGRPGTIRKEFASSIGENATHGSDAPETAAFEIGYFFAGRELVDR